MPRSIHVKKICTTIISVLTSKFIKRKDSKVQAFPSEAYGNAPPHTGMTMRDYFAAKAMPIAWGMYEKLYDCPPEDVISLVADYAYYLADAMMERRNAAQ